MYGGGRFESSFSKEEAAVVREKHIWLKGKAKVVRRGGGGRCS